jgi:hypothetical protein
MNLNQLRLILLKEIEIWFNELGLLKFYLLNDA